MEIRWSPGSVDDLTTIIQHARKDNVAAALRIARSLYQSIASLNKFPNQGRSGRVDGTRELPLWPLPFVVVYRVKEDAVEVVRISHGVQRWP
jgi:toxin ParE1/3/4